jgi:hypothetical protein
MGKKFRHDWRGIYLRNGRRYLHSDLHIDLPHLVKSEEVPSRKISFWKRIYTWFKNLILRKGGK